MCSVGVSLVSVGVLRDVVGLFRLVCGCWCVFCCVFSDLFWCFLGGLLGWC